MKKIIKIHFVGIGGSGISGVASLAQKMGYEVTGCDMEENTAYTKNIFKGHDERHIKDVDLVVISPAVMYLNPGHPEIVESRKTGRLLTWEEFLGKHLLTGKKIIAVAGTHGKSTTTAMVGKILEDAGLDPIVVVGAKVPEWNGNSRNGKGEYAVIEADEFNDNFLNYSPEIIILSNIEFDHPDYFASEIEVFESFKKFVGNLYGSRSLIVNEKDKGIKKLLSDKSFENTLKMIKLIKVDTLRKLSFKLLIPGKHNVKNAQMAVALGKYLKISAGTINKSLASFKGIGRRLELIGDRNGIKIYDDYAHHPTAISVTLEALRQKYPKQKILAIVEPHGYKRTKSLLPNYKGVFKSVDKVVIGPIFKARDDVDDSINPNLVAKVSGHPHAEGNNSAEKIIGNCKREIGNYDIVVVMGAGKSYLWARQIAKLNEYKN